MKSPKDVFFTRHAVPFWKHLLGPLIVVVTIYLLLLGFTDISSDLLFFLVMLGELAVFAWAVAYLIRSGKI